MKKLITSFALLSAVIGFGQEPMTVYEDSLLKGDNLLKLSSFNYYSSNRFNNDLMDKFIFGGEITPEIKDRANARLSHVNSIGAEAEQRIDHYSSDIHLTRDDRYGLIVSFSDNHLVSANIAEDLYRIAMYGNANYMQDTMQFAFSHLLYQHYQKMSVGFFEKRTLSSVQLSYVAGSKTVEGRLNDSWMYSDQDSILMMLQGTGFRTDRFRPYMGFQGSGVALDMNYNFMFDTRKGNSQVLNLKVNNLGFIIWNNQSHQLAVDSLSTYTGFDIQDFLNREEGDTLNYNFPDTLGFRTQQAKSLSAMPIEFTLQKLPIRNSGKKLQYLAGFKTILTADYFPYLFAGIYYEPINNFSASTRISYGGFGGLQWGLNLNYWILDRANFSLGTHNMVGNISKKFGYGRSINFSAYFKL